MATAPLAQPSRVGPKTVEEAVGALLKWRDAKSKTEKPQLLGHDEFVYLIVALKKIPQKSRTGPHRIPLPHPLIKPVEDSSEVCLVIDDRPKSQLTKDAATKKIKSENIPIAKVIKFSKLKTDYKPFEAKRKLCDSYDMFFADRRIIPLLPRLIGKQFFKKKKIPVAIDLKHKNWKEQIEKAFSSAMFYLRTGTCSVVKVGKLSMSRQEIAENIIAVVNGVSEIVPGKWNNVRSIHLKLFESLALPVYQALPNLKLKIEARSNIYDSNEKAEFVKDGNGDDRNEMESASGKKKTNKKGRIHEARYMDNNVSEMFDEDETCGDILNGQSLDAEDSKSGDSGKPSESMSKKRKKESKLNVVEPAKRISKGKKGDDDVQQKDVRQKRQKRGGEGSVGVKEKKKKKAVAVRN